MTVTVLVHEPSEVPSALRWAARLAAVREVPLHVLHSVQRKGDPQVKEVALEEPEGGTDAKATPVTAAVRREIAAIRRETESEAPEETPRGDEEEPEEKEDTPSPYVFKILYHPNPTRGVLTEVGRSKTRLLVLLRHEQNTSDENRQSVEQTLFRRAACQTLVLRPALHDAKRCEHILVPCVRGPHTRAALQLARDLAEAAEGTVTALYIEPEIGPDARAVGEKALKTIISRSLGSKTDRVHPHVVVTNRPSDVIHRMCEERKVDLVLGGAIRDKRLRQTLFNSVRESLLREPNGPAIGALRDSIPLTNRLRQGAEALIQTFVPQLERDQRVTLMERVQSNSHWDFDFVTLLCLSTLIAALGLAQNSAAVVIGAMLVAPLMTPLLGLGLALVQANPILAKLSLRSVVLGFVVSLFIGFVVRFMVPGFAEPTAEMLARTSPGRLDLIVAFASGLAAAYASSRPGLLAALPGVAIAAALVPPIATAGLMAGFGKFDLAAGAAILFLTNMVAIALGSAASLWMVGVRSQHSHGRLQVWTTTAITVLAILTLGLAVGLEIHEQATAGRATIPAGLHHSLEQELISHGAPSYRIEPRIHPTTDEIELRISLEMQTVPEPGLADRLAAAARPYYDRPVRVVVLLGWVGVSP